MLPDLLPNLQGRRGWTKDACLSSILHVSELVFNALLYFLSQYISGGQRRRRGKPIAVAWFTFIVALVKLIQALENEDDDD